MTWYHKDERIGTDDDLLEWAYSGKGEVQEDMKAEFEEIINEQFTPIGMLILCAECDNVSYEDFFKDWVFDFFINQSDYYPPKFNLEWRDEE